MLSLYWLLLLTPSILSFIAAYVEEPTAFSIAAGVLGLLAAALTKVRKEAARIMGVHYGKPEVAAAQTPIVLDPFPIRPIRPTLTRTSSTNTLKEEADLNMIPE